MHCSMSKHEAQYRWNPYLITNDVKLEYQKEALFRIW